MLSDDALIDITSATRAGDYRLRLSFSDGTQRTIDFEPFLRGSQNSQIRAYLDLEKFSHFRVDEGDLVWDDYGLCFPVGDL